MDVFAEFLEENLVECSRCGQLCKIGGPKNQEARLLRRATAEHVEKFGGLCVDCAATAFLKSIEIVPKAVEQHGLEMLLNPRIQQQFVALMVAGKSDARPEEISWQKVVSNWDLPFKKKSNRKRGKK